MRKIVSSQAVMTGSTQYVVGQFQTVGARHHNEDRLAVVTDLNQFEGAKSNSVPRAYFGCYDGHGGHSCSDFLKERMHEILVEGVHWQRGDVNAALYDAYLRAEVKYLADVNDVMAGSCSLSVVLQNNTLHLANCGDCRAVLFKVLTAWARARARGRGGLPRGAQQRKGAIALTRDHNPDDDDELERIQAAGGAVTQEIRMRRGGFCGLQTRVHRGAARVQPGSLAVSRSLGDCALKAMHNPPLVLAEPEVFTVPLDNACQFLILATDGVWGQGGGHMTSEEACKVVAKAVKEYAASGKGNPGNSAKDFAQGSAAFGNTAGAMQMTVADYAAFKLVRACEKSAEGRRVACDNTSAIVLVFMHEHD